MRTALGRAAGRRRRTSAWSPSPSRSAPSSDPEVVLAVLRGPVKSPLAEPPLTEQEREAVLGAAPR